MFNLSYPPPQSLHVTSAMDHSSNVYIHESTINSAQGDIHINNNKDSGMHDFRSVQKSVLIIDVSMKDFIS